MSHHNLKDIKLIVQTVKANCCPDALESDEVASTPPFWWRNQVFWHFDLVLIAILQSAMVCSQTITSLLLTILWLSNVDTITRECLPQMWECGEKVLGNVGEDGRRNLHTGYLSHVFFYQVSSLKSGKPLVEIWTLFVTIFILGKPLVVGFPWSQDPLGFPLPLLGSPVSIHRND